jgi:hypothetical protein
MKKEKKSEKLKIKDRNLKIESTPGLPKKEFA